MTEQSYRVTSKVLHTNEINALSEQQYSVSVGILRIATYEEIIACLRNMKAQAAWDAAQDFACRLFGGKVHRVEVRIKNEYDGGHSYTVFEDVTVYDALGNQVPYDLSLPYWSRINLDGDECATSLLQDFEIWLREEETSAAEPLSQRERERLLQVYAHGYVQDNNLYANEFNLLREDSTFLLDDLPPHSLLYVLLDQEEVKQDNQQLVPSVTASCHSDDYAIVVEHFNVTLWFIQASDGDIRVKWILHTK